MDWSAFPLFLYRALSHAGWQSGQASHADDCSSALPGTSVRHWSHRGCHSARHWEKCGWRTVSPGTETVRRLTTGYCLFQGFQGLPLSSKSNDILSFCMKQAQFCFLYLALLCSRWEKLWLLLLVIGYFTWETDTPISTNSSHSCWAMSLMRSQK